MRFGQTHGARPFATGQVRQIHLLLLFGSVGMQTFIGAVCQAWVHGPRLVGAVEHFIKTLVHHDGQALAAISRITTQGRPPAVCELFESLFKAIRRGDFMGLVV